MQHEERPAPVTAAEHAAEFNRSQTERDLNARVPYDVVGPDEGMKYFIAIMNKAGAPRAGDVASMEAVGWRRSAKPLPSGYGPDHVVMETERPVEVVPVPEPGRGELISRIGDLEARLAKAQRRRSE